MLASMTDAVNQNGDPRVELGLYASTGYQPCFVIISQKDKITFVAGGTGYACTPISIYF